MRNSVTNFGNIVGTSSQGGAGVQTLRSSGYFVRPGNIIRESSEFCNSITKMRAGGPIYFQYMHNRNPTLNETKASSILDVSISNLASPSPKVALDGYKRQRPQTAHLRNSADYGLQPA